MPDGLWLSKEELNALYYATVAGDLVFATEAQWGYHPTAVARLLARYAGVVGRSKLRILELGASNCVFANALLRDLHGIAGGGSELEGIDYLAVELSRGSLESAADRYASGGLTVRRGPVPYVASGTPAQAVAAPMAPPAPSLVALVTAGSGSPFPVNLGLVHAEATQFARASGGGFDAIIVNELLDDMPCHAYYADSGGASFEAVAGARFDAGHWRIRVERRPLPAGTLDELPPGSVTARSEAGAGLVRRLADLLVPGGMLLVHDYGFAEPFVPLSYYAPPQRSLSPLVEMEFPPGSEEGDFPRSFFRIFANEQWRIVQITNDVDFAELASALEGLGATTVLAHGNTIPNRGGSLTRGDGVFLSEFGLLDQDDDLTALLASLNARQAELRDRYVRSQLQGRGNAYFDVVFVKG